MATQKILGINFEKIFQVVISILPFLPPSPRNFQKLIELAEKIASKKALLRKDLAGRVYHEIVGEWSLKKGLATYFTEVPSAYLLAYLAKPELGMIADFACGSGTLLVATYSATEHYYRLNLRRMGMEKNPQEIEEEFFQNFMNSCYGLDVLTYASQIAVLNLALINLSSTTQNFNIFTLPLGARDEKVFLVH